MNFQNLNKEEILIRLLIALLVVVLLPILWPVIMVLIGFFLVLVLLDASQGGKALDQVAEKIANWIKGRQ